MVILLQFTRKNQADQRIAIDAEAIIAVEESSHGTIVTTDKHTWYVEETLDVALNGWNEALTALGY